VTIRDRTKTRKELDRALMIALASREQPSQRPPTADGHYHGGRKPGRLLIDAGHCRLASAPPTFDRLASEERALFGLAPGEELPQTTRAPRPRRALQTENY
jgi:hypothetical protein